MKISVNKIETIHLRATPKEKELLNLAALKWGEKYKRKANVSRSLIYFAAKYLRDIEK